MIRTATSIDVFRCVKFTQIAAVPGNDGPHGWLNLAVVSKIYGAEPGDDCVEQAFTFYADEGNIGELLNDLIKQLHRAREDYYRAKETK